MATLFSSDGAEVVQRALAEEPGGRTPPEALGDVYELERAAAFVAGQGFRRVALQFPDELLADSAAVAAQMEAATGSKMYILGDTSYGSCCVDEVAAAHVGAEAVVHYGPACLSPCGKVPVLHVFGRRPLDTERCVGAFRELYPDPLSHVVVLSDVVYAHALGESRPVRGGHRFRAKLGCPASPLLLPGLGSPIRRPAMPLPGGLSGMGPAMGRPLSLSPPPPGELERRLRPEYPHLVVSRLACEGDPGSPPGPGLLQQFGRLVAVEAARGLPGYAVFYVGAEGPALTNFLLSWNRCCFSSFDPATGRGRHETLQVNRALARRLYLVERARDARVVGILVGTLGVAGYLSVLAHLRDTLRRAGKRSYTLAMGKLNPAKLANFPEVDVFVLVACPQNSLLDSRDFYRPVVTPYELELACNPARAWSSLYVTDFRDLLPGGCAHVGFPDTLPGEGDAPDVSLITGELRGAALSSAPAPAASSALACRNPALALAEIGPAGSFLESRSWRGLEQQLGQTPVTKAVPGRRGIAIAYEDEACG
ncbi:2-(3-amino-3-carboxypropyl)histidine synthase subunit 2 isoform X2 [Emydura macquarii macquarii]|uniref:2-(3-amino-3-carboxypropyl)histidine synthase subunit 2 isoform X2 n=1 Tax=Emydura macquarii macquarii TaxID=1129001 RepID=UPI00352AA820